MYFQEWRFCQCILNAFSQHISKSGGFLNLFKGFGDVDDVQGAAAIIKKHGREK